MGKIEINKKKKEDRLYNTAFELFMTKGLAKTTISDIVEQSGVAKGTFYLYFKDKYDIKNKLISHKTSELFNHARVALLETEIEGFEEQLLFLIDHILNELDQNRALLRFISKDLAWGVFKGAFEEHIPDNSDHLFYDAFIEMISRSEYTFQNPEVMLFTIFELVGSTCYSCILYQQPVSLSEYQPILHKTVLSILDNFKIKNV